MAYRVVILASKGELPRDPEMVRGGVECVYLSSPYTAAAEFLAEPADALVINFSVFEKKQLKLLDLSRREGLELFGIGNGRFPEGFCADDLNGIRLGSAELIRDNILTLARNKNSSPASSEPKVPLSAGKYETEAHSLKDKELTPEYGRGNS